MAKRITLKDIDHVDCKFGEFLKEWTKHPDWTVAEFGSYFLIECLLYDEGGYVKFNSKELAIFCRMSEIEFAKTWNKIESKFQKRAQHLTHKKVVNELKKARARLQRAVNAGLKGAEKRWGGYSNPNGNPNRVAIQRINETKPNTNRSNNSLTNSKTKDACAHTLSGSLRFETALETLIKPRTNSDKLAFRNLSNWLAKQIDAGEFESDIFAIVLRFAEQAKKKGRNPAALLFNTLRREIGYSKKGKAKRE